MLSILFGEGTGPTGASAAEVVNGTSLPVLAQHGFGWRVSGGYNYADYFALEAAIARIGYLKSQAPYRLSSTSVADTLHSESVLSAVEFNLVGRLPLASRARVDITVGPAETSLNTTLSTQNGSGLPAGQSNPVHVRKFGFDAGFDAEWMWSEHVSLLAGYHMYPNAGSGRLPGSSSGTFSLLAAGVHIEF